MGGGGKSQTSTQQVSIPPEVLARYNAVNARAESVAASPFQQYGTTPEAFVAPLTQAQQQGIAQTQQYGQSAQPYFNAATQQLMQAQQQGQQQLAQAYQPLYQGYQTGQELGAGAQQYYTGAGAAALPFYQQAAGGLGAGLQYAGGLQGAALGQAAAAPGYAAPLQQYGAEAITGAPGAAAMPNMAAMRMGLGAARQAAPYYGAATAGTQAALQESAPYQGLATQAALAGSQAISPEQFSQQGINRYMSPFLSNVVQQTMAAQAQQNAQQRQALTGEAIKAGAFGGDRSGIAQANLAYQQNLANQQTIANLLQGGYGQALGAFQQQQGVNLAAEQANRAAQQQLAQQALGIGQQGYGQQLGAAQQMAGLGQALYGQGIQGAQTLSQLGQTQYGQQLGAGQAAAGLGQQLYGQGMTGAQFLQGLGQQGFAQQLAAAQQQQAMGQGLAGLGFQTGQALQGLGAQQAQLGQATAAQQAALAQQGYGMGAGTGQALAGLGQGVQAAGLQGAQAMLGAGQIQQQTEQAGKQALYNQFLQQQGYPFQVAQFLANIAMGTGALSGSTTTTTQPTPFFSDRKLKENIRKIGETKDGLPIYKFRYKGEDKDQTHIGYMADEVEKKHPDAVGEYGGAKYVDYDKVNARESMGGAVKDGGLGRSPYAPGGSVGANELAWLMQQVAQHQKMYGGPQTKASAAGIMPGGTETYVPQSTTPPLKVMTPASPPRQPQTGLQQVVSGINEGDKWKTAFIGKYNPQTKKYEGGFFEEAGDLYGKAKNAFSGTQVASSSSTPARSSSSVENRDEDRAVSARGGVIPRKGYQTRGSVPYESEGDAPYVEDDKKPITATEPQTNILGDVVASGRQQVQNVPKPGEPPKPVESGLGQGLKAAGQIASLGKNAMGAAKGLGSLLGGGEAAAGMALDPLTKLPLLGEAATGAASAVGGLGSAIGSGLASAGTAAMEALPLLLGFLSDERTKENKRVVGELFNGEKVIAYNHPGMPTQIGLGAQHVEQRDPYSVWENEHGIKYVDYDRATRYAGGLVPRQGYQQAGAVEGTSKGIKSYEEESPYDPIIRRYAEQEGVPYEWARRTAYNESRLNPMAQADTSTAGGIYQIIDKTLRGLGGDPSMKYDPEHNIQHGIKYMGQNMRALTSPDDPYGAAKTHLGHFLGTGGAKSVLANPDTPIAQTLPNYEEAVQANLKVKSPTGKPFAEWTGADALQWAHSKMTGQPSSGGARQVASAQGQQPQQGGLSGAASSLGDLLTSSRFWAPVGTGLLTMASSPSIRPGGAILQGIGAGLAAMQPAEQRAENIEQQRLTNIATAAGLPSNAFFVKDGILMVNTRQYGEVSVDKWMKLGQPPVIGSGIGSAYEAEKRKQMGLPAEEEKKPVDIGAPKPEETLRQIAPGVQFGKASLQNAKDEAALYYGPGREPNRKNSEIYAATTQAAAQQARGNSELLNELTINTANAVQQTGLGVPGTRFQDRADVVKLGNTINSMLDKSLGITVNWGNADSVNALYNKLNALNAAERTRLGGDDTATAILTYAKAFPSGDMPADVQAQLTAAMKVLGQKSLDRETHMYDYGKAAGVSSYTRAGDAFDKDNPDYEKQINLFKSAILMQPEAVKKMANKQATPEQIERFFQRLSKETGMQYVPGMHRMFRGQ